MWEDKSEKEKHEKGGVRGELKIERGTGGAVCCDGERDVAKKEHPREEWGGDSTGKQNTLTGIAGLEKLERRRSGTL